FPTAGSGCKERRRLPYAIVERLASDSHSISEPLVFFGALLMSFITRAVISLLSGIGAALLGFWAVWRTLIGSLFTSVPGPGYDGWLLAGIFIPGLIVPVVVFHQISMATRRQVTGSSAQAEVPPSGRPR